MWIVVGSNEMIMVTEYIPGWSLSLGKNVTWRLTLQILNYEVEQSFASVSIFGR